jgi:hypothetical protein
VIRLTTCSQNCGRESVPAKLDQVSSKSDCRLSPHTKGKATPRQGLEQGIFIAPHRVPCPQHKLLPQEKPCHSHAVMVRRVQRQQRRLPLPRNLYWLQPHIVSSWHCPPCLRGDASAGRAVTFGKRSRRRRTLCWRPMRQRRPRYYIVEGLAESLSPYCLGGSAPQCESLATHNVTAELGDQAPSASSVKKAAKTAAAGEHVG